MDGETTLPTTDGEDGDSFSRLNIHINNNEFIAQSNTIVSSNIFRFLS